MMHRAQIERAGGRTVRTRAMVVALGAMLLLSACAHANKRRSEQALVGLQRALSGVYSGSAKGGTADAVTLTISPITAQLIGDVVFFVRETPADNAQLVLWQGIWTLAPEAGGARDAAAGAADADDSAAHAKGEPRIVQHSFLFKDPRRFAAAASDPDLLESVLPKDLQALPGCDLVWQQTPSGYETVNDVQGCQPGARASGLWMAQRAHLDGSGLTLTERPVNDAGVLDQQAAPLSLQLSRSGSP